MTAWPDSPVTTNKPKSGSRTISYHDMVTKLNATTSITVDIILATALACFLTDWSPRVVTEF